MGETKKAHKHGIREGFFDKYCQGYGIDIGYGRDLLSENCLGWDRKNGDGDAQYLRGVENSKFDFVYSLHLLEHLPKPAIALKNW